MPQTTIWEKISKCCLCALIFLAPIMFLPWTADPVGINKQAAVAFLAILGFVFWLAKTLSEGKLVWPKSLIAPAVGLFVIVSGVSAYLSAFSLDSFYDLFGRIDNFPSLLTFALIFFLASVLLRTGDYILKSIWVFLSSAILLAVFQMLHFLSGSLFGAFLLPWDFSRVIDFNSVGTANALAIFFGLALITAVIMLASQMFAGKSKIILYVAAALFLAHVILIGFWPVWFGLVLAMIFLISYRFISELHLAKTKGASEFSIKKLSLPIAVFVIAFLLLLAKPPIGNFLNFAVEIKPTYDATMEIAGKVADQSWRGAFLGSGPGTFVNDYLSHRSASLNATNLWLLTFNQGSAFWPTILATGGYLGTAAFALLILAFIWTAFRAAAKKFKETPVDVAVKDGQSLELGVIFGVSGGLFLLILLFLYPFNYTLGIAWFFAMAVLVASAAGSKKNGWSVISILTSPQRALIVSLAIILLMTFSAYVFYFEAKNYIAEIYYGRALALSGDVEKIDDSINNLGRAVNLNPNKSGFLRALAQVFLIQIGKTVNQKPSETLTQTQIQAQLQTAIANAVNSAQAAAQLDKENFYNLWTQGSVYENIILFADGADKQAVQSYEEAFKRNPQSPSVQLDIARTHLAAADRTDLTLSALAQAEKKDEEKEAALKQEKEALLNSGKAALEKSIALKSDYVPAHYLFSQLYERTGDTAKAIEKAQDAKKFAPGDLGALFQLGRLYYNDNQLEKAQAEFEESVAVNPDYSNGRYFLGLVYDKRGFKNKAVAEFEKIKELNPDNKEVAQILENLKAGNPALHNMGQQPVPPAPPTEPAPESEPKSEIMPKTK